jgi:cell division protein FtsL
MAYVNGNLALQPKSKPEEQHVIREKKRVVVKRKSLPVGEKLLYLFTVLVCAVVAGVIIFRYAQIYDMNLQIKKLNSEYGAIRVEMEDLKRQVEMLSDPERIRQMAESQGMVSKMDDGITLRVGGNNTSTVMRE